MVRRTKPVLAALCIASTVMAAANAKQEAGLEAGRRAYEASDYAKAIQVLQTTAANDPQNGDVQLLLTKSYLEMLEYDPAIKSAEKAVAIDPQNSVYHEWLGRAYGEKADHASLFSAISLAKKTRKEFETAIQLDEKNFSARQALIEFDCSAPGIVGGGEEKALPQIKQLAEMDAAEGHYAAGNCRRQKKDFAVADEEFAKALESNPKSAGLIYDIGDYAVKRGQPERLLAVADMGAPVAPGDPRGKFYRGVALVLKKENPEEAERLLREYAKKAPMRSGYPRPAVAHAWLGRLFEDQNKMEEAVKEFESALKLDPKNKMAHEALKRLKKG
ncbi:MAG TPA: tetratricopeptide repeat protein [Candidatus Limnocylindria bacterium]|jgi:tetratricopeptide (TPR) repeat protein|nr:tetratricopeptide repeat protein [Candidatus Limnocylindria bacterium]